MVKQLLRTPFAAIQMWLEAVEIDDPATAQWICRIIPARCPFERRIYLQGWLICQIPPLCKLNPFYDLLITLRLKAIEYLSINIDD